MDPLSRSARILKLGLDRAKETSTRRLNLKGKISLIYIYFLCSISDSVAMARSKVRYVFLPVKILAGKSGLVTLFISKDILVGI